MSEKAIPEELRGIVQEDAEDGRCVHTVLSYTRLYWRQCLRKPKHMIRGFGFCTQHAWTVRKRLGSEL